MSRRESGLDSIANWEMYYLEMSGFKVWRLKAPQPSVTAAIFSCQTFLEKQRF